MTRLNIAFISSFIVSFIVMLMLIYIFYFVSEFHPIVAFLPFLVFISSFIIINLLVEKFINRKIKILYRTLSSIDPNKKIDNPKDPYLFEQLREKVKDHSLKKSIELDELKKNSQFRKEFLGNVSHELRTPLFNIQGFVEILEDYGFKNKNVNSKYLSKISSNTNRLINIVDDLVLISQVESDQINLNIEKFHLYEVCIEVIESLEEMSNKYNSKLSVKDTSYIDFTVLADRQKIFQVIHNLIENAIYYSGKGSDITIRFFDFESKVLVEIADNGKGIDEVHLTRLFERFYRVDSDRSRKKGGSGLGLSIVKKILEAHGETINVKSKIGVGTTFSFTLPKG